MVRLSPCCAVLLGSCCALAQTPAPKPAPDLSDPVQVLQTAVARNDIDAEGMSPWELKATVHLFDSKGNPTETLGLDMIWGGTREQKQVWTRQGASDVVLVMNPDGSYRSGSSSPLPDLVQMAVRTVVHPLPSTSEAKDDDLTLQQQKFGHTPFNCLINRPPPPLQAGFPGRVVLMSRPTLYCFDDRTLNYRFTMDNGVGLEATTTKQFQDRNYAAQAKVLAGNVVRASIHVDSVETIPQPDHELFVPDDDAIAQQPGRRATGAPLKPGKLLHRVEPVIPPALLGTPAKVVVDAVIGKDGHVRSVKPEGQPNPELASAVTDAVKQWVYEPFTRDGKAVETKTTMAFTFGK